MSDRVVKAKEAARLNVDELRALVRMCNYIHGRFHTGLDAQAILDLYHSAHDAGYFNVEDWFSEEQAAAEEALIRVHAEVAKRAEG